MAIKSKSFLRSKGLKAICVLLVLALTGVCMLSVCQAVDLANHLGGRSLESTFRKRTVILPPAACFSSYWRKTSIICTRWHLCIIQRKQSATARP